MILYLLFLFTRKELLRHQCNIVPYIFDRFEHELYGNKYPRQS